MNREFRNPNDEYDNPSWEEVEKEAAENELRKRIQVEFEPSEEQHELVARSVEFLLRILKDWQESFNKVKETEKISQKMLDYLQDKGLDLPSFRVLNKQLADKFLKEVGFNNEGIDTSNIFVIFNLPKPLSKYWWKGGNASWRHEKRNVERTVVEWGSFYEKLLPVIWKNVDGIGGDFEDLYLERINGNNIHDPDKYYYLWEISNQPFPEYGWDEEFMDE